MPLTPSSPPRPPHTDRRARTSVALTAVLALLSFVMPLATDMYLPAFPTMADELRTNASGVQLTLTAFMVGLALGQLVFGPLSDRYGRRRPILIGTGICAVATALCAVAPSLEWMILLRRLTGVGGAAGLVVGRAVVADIARGEQAARLFGILMALGGVAPIVAPIAGGAVVTAAGWRAVFWVLAAASVVTFAAACVIVPESLPAARRTPVGTAAVARSVRSVLADRAYLGFTGAFAFGSAALFCYISGSPFLLQNVLGLSVGQASAAFAAGALTATLSSALSARLVGRFTPWSLLLTGLVMLAAAATVALAVTAADRLGRIAAFTLLALAFVGLGLVFANGTTLAIGAVPHAAGAGSAVLGTAQSALGALAAPLMGLGGDRTALPLFLGMTVSAGIALLCLAAARSRPAAAPRKQFLGNS
ncbi:multidrug effflux MFS transporter [Streptomyces sp. TRM72054]|uniref:multidrug effflux MFS transporter n=1 Tax=Streptomyces sp. TRM72054 TaxID=2870562 RepID=UPI001C8BE554|nr:multidrug effflux MFS transporter [Streptomyces sp. TRM72054]MBX9396660.1 multidrug effflux MFS transporter [Streptomyces sp. TRM72054]